MKFETLKTGKSSVYKRSILIVSSISLVLFLTVTLYFSFARYKVTQTLKLAQGNISTKITDNIKVVAYWGEKQYNLFPAENSG